MTSLSANFLLHCLPFRTHLKHIPNLHHNFIIKSKNHNYSNSRISHMVELSTNSNPTHSSLNDSMDTHYKIRLKKLQKDGKHKECLTYLKSIMVAGYTPDVHFCGQLIQGFLASRKFGSAVQVVEILESYGESNINLYNLLIRGFCKNKKVGSALQILSHMKDREIMPNVHSYNLILRILCRFKTLELAVDEMRDANCMPTGLKNLILIGSKIVGGEIDQGVELIEKVFSSEGLEPNIKSYNKIIDAMCRDGQTDRALDLIRILQSKGYEPIVLNYNCLLVELVNQRRWNVVKTVLEEMLSTNCEPNFYTYSIMMRIHLRDGRIEEAMNLLKRVMETGLRPDHSFIPLVCEFSKDETLDFAVMSLDYIISCGSFTKIASYHPILVAFYQNGSVDQARRLVKSLEDMGYSPNVSTYNIMINNLWNQGDRSIVLEMVSEMLDKGIEPNNVTYNTLISCLCRDGTIDEAIAILKVIEMPSFLSYETVILGLCKACRIDEAIQILEEMVEKGYQPSESIYCVLTEGIVNAGLGTEARELTEYLFQINGLSSKSITRVNKIFTEMDVTKT